MVANLTCLNAELPITTIQHNLLNIHCVLLKTLKYNSYVKKHAILHKPIHTRIPTIRDI